MDNLGVVDREWGCVLALLPADLEASAVDKLALRRRREIRSASDLLRLALGYALCDFSLGQTAAWAALVGIGHLSAVAVLKRLRQAEPWLGFLVVQWLQEHRLTAALPALSARVLDATVVCAPGSQGADWRVHLGLNLAQSRICSVEVTDARGGESLLRHRLAPDELALADRGYGYREGVASVLAQEGHVLVRIGCRTFPLLTAGGERIGLPSWIELLEVGEVGDWAVQFHARGQSWPVRLIAIRKTQAAAAREQARVRHEATRKQRQPDPDSHRAAQFVMLVTDLPAQQLSAVQALELYRLRWQIELCFKRLKGIVHLDHLRARDPALARSYLYAKLLGALIVEELCEQARTFSPWGYPLGAPGAQPLANCQPLP